MINKRRTIRVLVGDLAVGDVTIFGKVVAIDEAKSKFFPRLTLSRVTFLPTKGLKLSSAIFPSATTINIEVDARRAFMLGEKL